MDARGFEHSWSISAGVRKTTQGMHLLIDRVEINMVKKWVIYQVAHGVFVVFLAKATENAVKRRLYVFSRVKWLIYQNSCFFRDILHFGPVYFVNCKGISMI